MKPELKKTKEAVQNIRLSENEKAGIDRAVFAHMAAHPLPAPLPSPYHFWSVRTLSYSFSALIIFGSVAFGSEFALPGNFLYSIKTGINEPTATALSFTDAAKARVHATIAEKRLREIEQVSLSADADPVVLESLNAEFKKNAEEAHAYIAKLNDAGETQAALETSADLSSMLDAHAEILAEVDKHDDESQTALVGIIAEVATQQEKAEDANTEALGAEAAPAIVTEDTINDAEAGITSVEERLVDEAEDASARNTGEANLVEEAKATIGEARKRFSEGKAAEALMLKYKAAQIADKASRILDAQSDLEIDIGSSLGLPGTTAATSSPETGTTTPSDPTTASTTVDIQ